MTTPSALTPLALAYAAIWILLGVIVVAGVLRQYQALMIRVTFPLCIAASLMAASAGFRTLREGLVASDVLIIGLPDLPFHIRLDPLAGFFLMLIGLLSAILSLYSMGYLKDYLPHRRVTRLVIFYSAFIAGMMMVVLADDALFFLISWETMAAASYFLVIFEDEKVENRKAAFLYMVVAHVGAVTILLSFGVMAGLSAGFENFSGFTFDAMRQANFPIGWATVAFALAFVGFGAKAGVIPLHVWLPEAHPVAPSNISALMSGVMLKTAIYGILRVTFDLIRVFPWWWGGIVLVFGLVSAFMGILYALMQVDIKRLLAYSSVENIGVILTCIGLAMMFLSFELPVLAALALVAGLYHALNHALFKGLLFMGAGAVLHATKERNMEHMGGLIHLMPWTSSLFLVGCISISALPPFNGFVSEWLTFQAFLLSSHVPNQIMRLLMPMGAALLALSGALAAACFVRAYGVMFLGHWRGKHAPQVHEVDWYMRTAMLAAAAACLALGVMPNFFIETVDALTSGLVGASLSSSATAWGWLWLTPIAPERASYSGLILFVGGMAVYGIVYVALHVDPGKVRRGEIWDCGFEKLTARMQYTAVSFAMPLRRVFGFLFLVRETARLTPQAAHPAFPRRIVYSLRVRDRIWHWLYRPVVAASFWVSRKVGMLQQGRIQTYLIYSFVTVIVLLLIKSL
jgi:formate hydrogenlyase subunit 3/multisubunit Na+/H+ antiporter MnhD subunit